MKERLDQFWSQRDVMLRVGIASAIALIHTPLIHWLRNLWHKSSLDEIILSVAMPLTIAGLLYLRRADLYALHYPSKKRSVPGMALVFLGLLSALASVMSGHITPLALSAPISIHGYLMWTRGYEKIKPILIPLYLIIFLVPGTYGDLTSLSEYLQHTSASSATMILQMFNYPSFLDGITIVTSGTFNHVTEACSGMTTLTTLLVYGLVFSFLFKLEGRYIIASLAAILSLALIANASRIAFISYLLVSYGEEVANGPLHNSSGIAAFAVAYLLMFIFVRQCAKHQK